MILRTQAVGSKRDVLSVRRPSGPAVKGGIVGENSFVRSVLVGDRDLRISRRFTQVPVQSRGIRNFSVNDVFHVGRKKCIRADGVAASMLPQTGAIERDAEDVVPLFGRIRA